MAPPVIPFLVPALINAAVPVIVHPTLSAMALPVKAFPVLAQTNAAAILIVVPIRIIMFAREPNAFQCRVLAAINATVQIIVRTMVRTWNAKIIPVFPLIPADRTVAKPIRIVQ